MSYCRPWKPGSTTDSRMTISHLGVVLQFPTFQSVIKIIITGSNDVASSSLLDLMVSIYIFRRLNHKTLRTSRMRLLYLKVTLSAHKRQCNRFVLKQLRFH